MWVIMFACRLKIVYLVCHLPLEIVFVAGDQKTHVHMADVL